MIEAASSIAIAKPIPSALDADAVLMPMTRPLASSSGPPLLPSLMAASVWRRLLIVRRLRVAGSPTVIDRPVADRMPLVTESVIVTTAGLTFAATWTTASEPVSWTTVWAPADGEVPVPAAVGDASAAGRTSATVAREAAEAEITDAPMAAASSRRTRGGRGRVVDGPRSGWLEMAGGAGWTSVGRGNVSMPTV